MQFYHPEILYGFFALAIPIIVHLFQLRKFKLEPFTNVALLKKLVISSRKSSKIKKWLSLITRLLIITCLVMAFAQPYIPNANVTNKTKQINIFLDNSFSMSLKGENKNLLDEAKEDLLEYLPESQTYNLITHNDIYRNLASEDLKSLLFDLDYYSNPLDIEKILQKTQSAFDNSTSDNKEMIVISDFQNINDSEKPLIYDDNINYNFIKIKPQNPINFSIDTTFIETSANEKLLNFTVSATENITQSIPVSIYNKDDLLGKLSLNFEDEVEKSYSFNLQENDLLEGKIEIDDIALTYDNTLYFSISKPEKIKVLVISEKATNYLDKLYSNERFNYKQVLINKLEFEDIASSDVVILNEIENISNALSIAIKNYADDNGILTIIPSVNANLLAYNKLFEELNLEPYNSLNKNSVKLTNINFNHPIYRDVFTEKIKNFDYPTFESYFSNFSTEKALSFSNGLSFLESKKQVFRFNAPIADNSNFMQSPLVVLSFYNIALMAQNKEILYLNMGDNYEVKLKEEFQQDHVLSLSKGSFSFIPRQKAEGKNIKINFTNYPEDAGHYYLLTSAKDTLNILAFNSLRKESKLVYLDPENLKNLSVFESFEEYSDNFYESTKIKSLWQWFIAFALIFMIIELLLLRFLK